MGLIKLVMDTAGGVISDQFLEYFYCNTIDNDTLMVKGTKVQTARGQNNKASDNIIRSFVILPSCSLYLSAFYHQSIIIYSVTIKILQKLVGYYSTCGVHN